jgi:hypothetical protein
MNTMKQQDRSTAWQVAKIIFALFLLSAIIMLTLSSCGPSAEEKAWMEQQMKDSLNAVENKGHHLFTSVSPYVFNGHEYLKLSAPCCNSFFTHSPDCNICLKRQQQILEAISSPVELEE